jgi:site-specific recombinase XerD
MYASGRNRALLLLGFAGAFRRSELVALNVADIQECEGGLRVRIGRSKTDQEAPSTGRLSCRRPPRSRAAHP